MKNLSTINIIGIELCVIAFVLTLVGLASDSNMGFFCGLGTGWLMAFGALLFVVRVPREEETE